MSNLEVNVKTKKVTKRDWTDEELAELRAAHEASKPTAKQIAQKELLETDKQMARIAEDVIDVLITKQLLAFTDLPEYAQNVITERRTLRSKQ